MSVKNWEHDVGKLESPNSQVCVWLTRLDFFPILGCFRINSFYPELTDELNMIESCKQFYHSGTLLSLCAEYIEHEPYSEVFVEQNVRI